MTPQVWRLFALGEVDRMATKLSPPRVPRPTPRGVRAAAHHRPAYADPTGDAAVAAATPHIGARRRMLREQATANPRPAHR